MNKNYRGWTIEYYAGAIPARNYSAQRHDRKSGTTVTLYGATRVEIEREVDSYIQANDLFGGREVLIPI